MFRDEALNTFTHEANETLQIEIDLSECLTINAVPCLSHMVTFADVRSKSLNCMRSRTVFPLSMCGAFDPS